MEEEPVIAKGFDRDVSYSTMKDKLIHEYKSVYGKVLDCTDDKKYPILIHKLIYLVISTIQLRNGSRVSEAVAAFRKFLNVDDNVDKVIVKISKSDGIKYDKTTKKAKKSKARFRKVMFPDKWIDRAAIEQIKSNEDTTEWIKSNRLKKRVLDYLLKNFECNTHSLRYAFINYMLYDQKKEMSLVAKFVGHVNVAQLVTYTQQKNTEQIFDLDI